MNEGNLRLASSLCLPSVRKANGRDSGANKDGGLEALRSRLE